MSVNRYLVTARKYRPQLFNEIVAQEHVSETLKNAISLDRLAHAYLFSGPRGVGKTTAARILAKAINCTTSLENRDQGEPCRECESCHTFEEGRSLSIIEIDAASNNRVEDIRELRDTVLIPPQGSRKKVYIIDEVHMLSNAAFNALLKTLEEPPGHALFIFATTEPNKVLPTILSRCQRFDFRRISVPEIVAHLQEICRQEDIEADENSLMLLAHKGDGALRDALSAFDQAVSLCGAKLTYQELAKAFGVVDVDLFFEVTEHVKEGNGGPLLLLIDRILGQGYDMQEFMMGLAGHLRNLLVASTMADTSLIEAAESVKERYAKERKQFAEADLLRLLMIVSDGENQLKTSVQPRLQMELTMLKMAAMTHAVDLKAAISKLDALEEKWSRESTDQPLESDETTSSAASPGEPPVSAAASSEEIPVSPAGASVLTLRSGQDIVVAVTDSEDEPGTADDDDGADPGSPEPAEGPAPSNPGETSPSPKQQYETLFGSPALRKEQQYETLFGSPALRKVHPKSKDEDKGTSALYQEDVIVAEAPSVEEVDWIKGIWSDFLHQVKMERIHVSALLQHTAPHDVRDETLVLSVPDEFHKRMLSSQKDFLLGHLNQLASLPVERMSFVIDLARADEKKAKETAREIDPQEYMQKKRSENPVIKAIFDDFGGEMVW